MCRCFSCSRFLLQDEISMTDSDASDLDESESEDDAPAGAAGVSSDVGMCQVMNMFVYYYFNP